MTFPSVPAGKFRDSTSDAAITTSCYIVSCLFFSTLPTNRGCVLLTGTIVSGHIPANSLFSIIPIYYMYRLCIQCQEFVTPLNKFDVILTVHRR